MGSISRAGAFALGLVTTLLITSVASADDYVERNDGAGQNIVFKDDPLAAGGFGPNDTVIRVAPTPKRVMLLRARTHFVPELLKSVESL